MSRPRENNGLVELSSEDVSLIDALTKETERRPLSLDDPAYLALARAYLLGDFQKQFNRETLVALLHSRFEYEAFPVYENGIWHGYSFQHHSALPLVQDRNGGILRPHLAGVVETTVDFEQERIAHRVCYLFGAFMSRTQEGIKPTRLIVSSTELDNFVKQLSLTYQKGNGWHHQETAQAVCIDWAVTSMAEYELFTNQEVASPWWFDAGDREPVDFFEAGVPFEFWKFVDPKVSLAGLSPSQKEMVAVLREGFNQE